MSELKIGFVLNRLTMGGIETLLVKIAEQLADLHDITFICVEGEGAWDVKLKDLKISQQIFSYWQYANIEEYILRLADFINESLLDVIFINDTFFGASVVPLIDSSIKKVMVLHAIDEQSLKKSLIHQAYIDGYIAVSPKTKHLLRENGCSPICAIPNGINLFDLPVKTNNVTAPLKVIYCGRLSHSDKGILYLPSLLAHINRSVQLDIIGEGKDYEALYNGFKKRYQLNNVRFLGVKNEQEVRVAMAKADFLVAPSNFEGFGLVLIEAQSVGCIPVTFLIEGVTDAIIEDGKTGLLCEYQNIEQMAQKMQQLWERPNQLARMRQKAIENGANYTITKTAQRWIQFASTLTPTVTSSENRLQTCLAAVCESVNPMLTHFKENVVRHSESKMVQALAQKRVFIFGTLQLSYFMYAYLKEKGVAIAGFIDNQTMDEMYINHLPVLKEQQLSLAADDYIVVTVESEGRHSLKERLRNDFVGSNIILWDEFF